MKAKTFFIVALSILTIMFYNSCKKAPEYISPLKQSELENIQHGDFIVTHNGEIFLATDRGEGEILVVLTRSNDMFTIYRGSVVQIVKKDSIEVWAKYARKFLDIE